MKHFVLIRPKGDPDESYGLPLEDATLKEARAHMNDRNLYPDPTAWKFRLFRGTELSVDFQAVVKIKQ